MGFTVIRAARLWDGTGAPVLEQAAILIEGERIRAVARAAEIPVPNGATPCRRCPASAW